MAALGRRHDRAEVAKYEFGMMTNTAVRWRFSLLSLLLAMASLAIVLAAFSRGNYLFGARAGITYATVALALLAMLSRAIRETPVPRLRLAFLALFSMVTCFGFAFPAYINPSVYSIVRKQADARLARQELRAVFAEDPAYAELTVQTTPLKIVNVDINGAVPSKVDVERLQLCVYQRCEFVQRCFVHWRLRAHEDSKTYVARNNEAFAIE